MKVRGPRGPQGPGKTSKKSTSSSADAAAFGSMISSGPEEAGVTSSAHSIAHLDVLLAVQGAEDPLQGKIKQRMRKRADSILDLLDEVRGKMLGGNLTIGDMIDVADVVASHREKIEDPALTDVMDEVDLRAQVELAKMRVVLDKNNAKHENQA